MTFIFSTLSPSYINTVMLTFWAMAYLSITIWEVLVATINILIVTPQALHRLAS